MKNPKTLLLAAIAVALGLGALAPALAQESFPTPEAAAEALVAALGNDKADPEKLRTLLGADWNTFIPTDNVNRSDVDYFLEAYANAHELKVEGDKAHLVVGDGNWTLPLPLSRSSGAWHFDPKAAVAEITARRIGANEINTLQSMLAYHDAQIDYATKDRDDDGVLEYAQKILSTEGEHDGLYWSEDATGELSPLGPLYGDATPGGDWHGYQFHVLRSQGASAPGGAYDYMLGDNMSRGFALVAWPAKYGDTGIMSFMISHEGVVFEKDIGPGGGAEAKAMKAFDPDSSWEEVSGSMIEVVPDDT